MTLRKKEFLSDIHMDLFNLVQLNLVLHTGQITFALYSMMCHHLQIKHILILMETLLSFGVESM